MIRVNQKVPEPIEGGYSQKSADARDQQLAKLKNIKKMRDLVGRSTKKLPKKLEPENWTEVPSLSNSKSKTLTRNWEISTHEQNMFNQKLEKPFFDRR